MAWLNSLGRTASDGHDDDDDDDDGDGDDDDAWVNPLGDVPQTVIMMLIVMVIIIINFAIMNMINYVVKCDDENDHHQVSGDKNITSSVLAFAPKYQDLGKNLTCRYEVCEI